MKKIIYLLCAGALAFASCTKEDNPGGQTEIPATYDIMAQNGPEELNTRLMGLYEKYGAYFLYDFVEKDALYQLVNTTSAGAGTQSRMIATKAEVEYVNLYLDLLEESWFKYIPVGKERERVPYRVFLADSVGRIDSSMPMGMQFTSSGAKSDLKGSMILSGINHTLPAKGTPAWDALVFQYTKLFFNSPLQLPSSPENLLPEFWKVSKYLTAEDQKSWRPGTGSIDDGTYKPGGELFEEFLPGCSNPISPPNNPFPDMTDAVATNVTVRYKPKGENAAAEVSVTYSQATVRLRINQEMAKMGFVPQFQTANLTNPGIYATPWGNTNGLSNWNFESHKHIYAYEMANWAQWTWATNQQIADSGWFDGTYPLLKQKMEMIVDAYWNLLEFDIRYVADPANNTPRTR